MNLPIHKRCQNWSLKGIHHCFTGCSISFADLGWVDFDIKLMHCLTSYAWADGSLAEAAGQQGKFVEH